MMSSYKFYVLMINMIKEVAKLCFIYIALGIYTLASIIGSKRAKQKLTQIYRQLLCVENLPQKDLNQYVNQDITLQLPFVNYHNVEGDRDSLLNLETQRFLALIAQIKKPKTILEIGFFMGSSMRIWLENTTNALITSIDIDFSKNPNYMTQLELNERVQLINKDSKELTPKDFKEKFDLIFIDGAHDYKSIKSDTELAFQLISPSGIIIWDDNKYDFPGVWKYLNELQKKFPLKHIPQTSLVILED